MKELPAKFVQKNKPPAYAGGSDKDGGKGGIRTHGTLLRFTAFPVLPVQPLLHLSARRSECAIHRVLNLNGPTARTLNFNFRRPRQPSSWFSRQLPAPARATSHHRLRRATNKRIRRSSLLISVLPRTARAVLS